MGNKNILNLNKEERLAFVVLMFFSLAWLSPVVWDNFDRTKEVIAKNTSIEMGYAEIKPKPSASFVVEDFFKRINYYDIEGASALIYDDIEPGEVIKLFDGLYNITATNIVINKETNNYRNYSAIINAIYKGKRADTFFTGTDKIIITLKKTNIDEWRIYGISRLD